MDCRRCGTDVERPGDYCLACDTANCDAVVAVFDDDRATLTMLDDEEVVGETTVTTVPESGEETGTVQLRNFAGRVADEIRRKRPETVYAAGARAPLRETRAQLHHQFYRVGDDGAVEEVLSRRGDRALEVVETNPLEKLGGSHSTLIGDRDGMSAVQAAAQHPHVKKIIPGPISAGGSSSPSGLRAKATRADENGNVRLLLRDGSSVQENRVVTTAMDRERGERVREDLNEALAEAGFQ
ncbi:metal-binding protein [halophilic archaeon]|nr:metal-binding protein [halophilic archaeon]